MLLLRKYFIAAFKIVKLLYMVCCFLNITWPFSAHVIRTDDKKW